MTVQNIYDLLNAVAPFETQEPYDNSGLLVGSGVGLLVLLRMNRDWRDNLLTVGILYIGGVAFGMIAGALGVF